MPRINPTRFQTIFALAALLFVAAAAVPTPARAQVVAVVNGEPITVLDVAERLKLHRGSGKNTSKKEVLEELIEYKLKLQVAQRAGITLTDSEVDRAYAGIAARSGRTLEQFEQALRQGGIDPSRLKARVKADLAWQKYIQANPANVIVRDADLVAAMQQRGETLNMRSTQYTMQQVIFVVRRNAPVNVKQARLKEAESLRSRITSCSQVQEFAHEYKEVVVKPPLRRFSSDLSPALQKLLETLPDGRMTPPEVTVNGIEIVAICDRKEVPADVSANRELRNELLGQRVQSYEKTILDKMRQTSIIRYVGEP